MTGFWAMTAGSSGFVDDLDSDWRPLVTHLGLDPDAGARADLVQDGAITGWAWDPEAEGEIIAYIMDVGHRRIRRVGT